MIRRPRSSSPSDPVLSDDHRSEIRVVSRVAPYLWPPGETWVKIRVVVALTLLLLAKVVAVGTPYFYKAAVDQLAGEGQQAAWMLGAGAIGLTVAYGMARLLNVSFQQLRDAIFAKVAQRALRTLALETFRHIHRMSLRYHTSRKTGGLSRIIERGVKGVEFLLRFLLFSIGPLVVELLMISAVLVWLFDVRYLLVVLITIVAYVTFTIKVTEIRLRQRREMNQNDTEANQRAIDSLLNFETVKYFGAEDREAERYDAAMAGYEKAALKTSYSLAFLNIGQSFLITAGLVLVMAMAAAGVASGDLTVGDFVMVNAYMIQITMPLNFLGFVYREIRQALVDMSEMFGLLEQVPDVNDRPGATALREGPGAVQFDAVRFGYDDERAILNGVDLDVAAGSTIALVGPSGSGKSTLGRLLFRFYDVTGGAVRIDGQDIRDVTLDSLHTAIGVVPQDTVLFNDTIGYNIAYGRDGATQEEIEAAARSAQLHEFISGLPEGYETQVGERGLKLSGGEKQRVGIARTLLKDPRILLLDEATSALDSETEQGILGALKRAGDGRTVITIAHRLSTIADADRILVMEGGVIVEEGDHSTLMEKQGRYAGLWARQIADHSVDASAIS
ncbi:MAG: ABC transporter ATP-binding protein/permease [Pseudomonadota bacterium]